MGPLGVVRVALYCGGTVLGPFYMKIPEIGVVLNIYGIYIYMYIYTD